MDGNIINYSNINYELKRNSHTAEIVSSPNCNKDVIIPRSIKVEFEEYFVTAIKKYSFDETELRSISFPEDSLLKTIEKNSFYSSDIESIYLPSSVEDLQDGWCNNTDNLNQIKISPNNKRYKVCEENNMLIIGKSDINKEEYDEVIFVNHNTKLEKLVLPDYIKKIRPFALDCNIKSIGFSENSKLQEIMSNSIAGKVENLYIPAGFEKFEDGWCKNNYFLKKVTISPLNKRYKNCETDDCLIIGKSDQNKDVYDELIFASRNFSKVKIPNYITIIKPYAFYCCTISEDEMDKRIEAGNYDFSNSIEFQEESKLQTIGKACFKSSFLKEITIPKSVKTIGEYSFNGCRYLQSVVFEGGSQLESIPNFLFESSELLKTVKIPEDSIIKSIGSDTFIATKIEELYIPSTVEEFLVGCFTCETLNNIIVSPFNKIIKNYEGNRKLILGKSNKNKDCFDSIVFACRDIKNPIIPKFINEIKSLSIVYCLKLETIQFEKDSELQSIESSAFCFSYLKGIVVPKNVCTIWQSTFDGAIDFKCAEFLAENMKFYQTFNYNCPNIQLISFPNVHKLEIFPNLWSSPQRKTHLFVCNGADLIIMDESE